MEGNHGLRSKLCQGAARVLRGGSFYDDHPDYFRCADRYRDHPDFRYYRYGLRIVRSPAP